MDADVAHRVMMLRGGSQGFTGGLAGAGAPWVAEQIKLHTGHSENGEWKTDSPVANLVAHTILGAVVAELQGHSGVVGGASAVSGEIAAPIIQKALYGDRDVKDLTEEEKENISALTQLAVGLTIASMGGDESDITTGVNSSKNAVENNLLSNKRGVEKLNEESRKLWEKIKDIVGYDEVDKLQEQYNDCKTDECRNNVYNEYMQKEQEAGQKLVELYKSGGLSEDEYFQLVSWYSDAMRDGIMEGQIDNRWNHSFGSWDIYDASGWDFTQTGLVNNPYLSEIRGLVLLNKWRSEGLSESEIQEKFINDAILGSFASAPNVNQIIHKIRNEGLSYEDALMLASNALYGKIISEAMNGKVLPPKGNKNSENHNIKEESAGKGTTGTTSNGYKASNGADNTIAKTDLDHPIVQSRINIKTGDIESGWIHVQNRHFSGKTNASQFTISETDVKAILNSSDTVKIPISNTRSSYNKVSGQTDTLYERVIRLDKYIGIDKFSGKPTNTMTILTDKKGNLVTVTPGRIK
ncbi:VENN motif pre-toxin domain-containing protein [Gilliamella sp. wkB108]|uniref:VENN motif pre-toxin domain-containing protein n=1 Tax=Gilliamella sp. wkB108 TaxID=3120256 RepID=UPI00114774AE|nr:VENN motif pre-toxin domain-containing protein [Gilliamella apicola]